MADLQYQMRKRNHLCVCCGEKDAYTMAGRAVCAECAGKRDERFKERYKSLEVAEHYRETMKKRYERLTEAGMCVRCGRNTADKGYTTCGICRAKHNAMQNARNARKREAVYDAIDIPEDERCVKCRKHPRYEDHKLCRSCYESTVAAIRRRSKKNAANHPWRDYWKGRKRE